MLNEKYNLEYDNITIYTKQKFEQSKEKNKINIVYHKWEQIIKNEHKTYKVQKKRKTIH